MDANSEALDAEIGFGVINRSELRLFQSPEQQVLTAEPAPALDESATDLDLCTMAADGHRAAFELIYRRHHRRIFAVTFRMTKSPTEAEDLTQEVFIQLFRKIGTFRGGSAFSTWLHRLTVNQVLMYFRRQRVRKEKTSESGEMPDQTVNGTSNPNKMPVIDRIALKSAIGQLPIGYRKVFVLRDVEGFDHDEVARILGISVGTSKSQLHKARLKLRQMLIKTKLG